MSCAECNSNYPTLPTKCFLVNETKQQILQDVKPIPLHIDGGYILKKAPARFKKFKGALRVYFTNNLDKIAMLLLFLKDLKNDNKLIANFPLFGIEKDWIIEVDISSLENEIASYYLSYFTINFEINDLIEQIENYYKEMDDDCKMCK